MKYTIINTKIASITLSSDNSSIKIDVTIFYNIENSKMQSSSTGCTIEIPLNKGERNTLVEELNSKVKIWFEENYNS